MDVIEKVIALRIELDGLATIVKNFSPIKVAIISGYKNSIENNKAYESLILTKAWLGKVLETLGTETPYKNDGKRKEASDIEPAADTASATPDSVLTIYRENKDVMSYVEQIDWVREYIKELLTKVGDVFTEADNLKYYMTNIIVQHLTEARFWLGFELQRIKEKNINN